MNDWTVSALLTAWILCGVVLITLAAIFIIAYMAGGMGEVIETWKQLTTWKV